MPAHLLLSPWFSKERKPLIERLFGPVLNLTENGWKKLNFAWACMFVVMSCLHIFFAYLYMGGKYWGEFTGIRRHDRHVFLYHYSVYRIAQIL